MPSDMTDLERAKALWGLLDDIDTLSDMLKESPTSEFERMALRRAERRHAILESDGYTLSRPGEGPPVARPEESETSEEER